MKSSTRRLLWALGSLLVLIGLGAYFFYATTSQALERAESAQFRHMVVSRLGDQNRIRFFFATNRNPVAGAEDKPLKERFGTELRLANPETPLNRLRLDFRTPEGKQYSVLTRDQ